MDLENYLSLLKTENDVQDHFPSLSDHEYERLFFHLKENQTHPRQKLLLPLQLKLLVEKKLATDLDWFLGSNRLQDLFEMSLKPEVISDFLLTQGRGEKKEEHLIFMALFDLSALSLENVINYYLREKKACYRNIFYLVSSYQEHPFDINRLIPLLPHVYQLLLPSEIRNERLSTSDSLYDSREEDEFLSFSPKEKQLVLHDLVNWFENCLSDDEDEKNEKIELLVIVLQDKGCRDELLSLKGKDQEKKIYELIERIPELSFLLVIYQNERSIYLQLTYHLRKHKSLNLLFLNDYDLAKETNHLLLTNFRSSLIVPQTVNELVDSCLALEDWKTLVSGSSSIKASFKSFDLTNLYWDHISMEEFIFLFPLAAEHISEPFDLHQAQFISDLDCQKYVYLLKNHRSLINNNFSFDSLFETEPDASKESLNQVVQTYIQTRTSPLSFPVASLFEMKEQFAYLLLDYFSGLVIFAQNEEEEKQTFSQFLFSFCEAKLSLQDENSYRLFSHILKTFPYPTIEKRDLFSVNDRTLVEYVLKNHYDRIDQSLYFEGKMKFKFYHDYLPLLKNPIPIDHGLKTYLQELALFNQTDSYEYLIKPTLEAFERVGFSSQDQDRGEKETLLSLRELIEKNGYQNRIKLPIG